MASKINQNSMNEKDPRKRVLFVITQSEWGGAQRFLFNTVTSLNPEKYSILVVSGTDGGGELIRTLKEKNIETRELKTLKRSINLFRDLRAITEIKKLIKEFRPDTLFLNSSKAGIVGSLAGKASLDLKVIYRIGGWSFNDPLPWLVRQFYIWAEKYTAKFKDVIIVNNSHDFEQAKELGIKPRQKLELVYNGIDPYKLEFLSKEGARSKLQLPPTKLTIGTIANFYKTKGLEYLIEAVEVLRVKYGLLDFHAVIIGDGPERKNLEELIKEKKLEDRVMLAGRLPEAYKYLSAFDIFVLPSVKEGFAWAILEAMSAKIPVIATNVGAAAEILEDKNNGLLVNPKDSNELASAINSLAINEELRKELAIQAHQTVLHKFSFDKMMGKIESLL